MKRKLKPSAGLLILLSYLLLSLVALIPGCFGSDDRPDGPRIAIPIEDSVAVSVKEVDPLPRAATTIDDYLLSFVHR